jgi:hypothetical protein
MEASTSPNLFQLANFDKPMTTRAAFDRCPKYAPVCLQIFSSPISKYAPVCLQIFSSPIFRTGPTRRARRFDPD